MRVMRIVEVLHPFLQLSPLADLRHEQFIALGGQRARGTPVRRPAHRPLDGVVKQVPHQFLIERDALLLVPLRAVFGREAARGKRACRRAATCSAVEPEFADLLHHRISQPAQILLVAGERVVVPDVLQAPRAGPAGPRPGRTAEQAVFAVHGPAARVERLLGRLLPHVANRVQPVGHRAGNTRTSWPRPPASNSSAR